MRNNEVLTFTSQDLSAENLAARHLVLVDFWASWCGPCRMLSPIVEELAGELDDVTFAKVNVDENYQAAMELGIAAIPTLILFKDGQPVDRTTGLMSKGDLEAFIRRNR